MSSCAEILSLKQQLAASIRAYSESQAELWQRVPWLALQADGRDGGMGGDHAHAYESGLWRIYTSGAEPGTYGTFIDCATGRIVHLYDRVFRPEKDDDLILLANLTDQLDAAAAIARLEAKIEKPRRSWISAEVAEAREKERQDIAVRFGLKKIYVRMERNKAA